MITRKNLTDEHLAKLNSLLQSEQSALKKVNRQRDLENQRHLVACWAYEDHDFGAEVKGQNGWEYTTPGDTFARTVFVEPSGEDDGEDEPSSIKVRFVVRFKSDDSSEIAEVFST